MNFISLTETVQQNATEIYAGAHVLREYSLVCNYPSTNGKDCFLNLEKKSEDEVWGGVFRINDSQLHQIRIREAFYKNRYSEIEVQVSNQDGEQITALTYIANYTTDRKGNNPGDRYASLVRQGLKDCQLPNSYQEKIESWVLTLTAKTKD